MRGVSLVIAVRRAMGLILSQDADQVELWRKRPGEPRYTFWCLLKPVESEGAVDVRFFDLAIEPADFMASTKYRVAY